MFTAAALKMPQCLRHQLTLLNHTNNFLYIRRHNYSSITHLQGGRKCSQFRAIIKSYSKQSIGQHF